MGNIVFTNISCLLVPGGGKVSALKSFETERRLIFWGIFVALQTTCRVVGRGPWPIAQFEQSPGLPAAERGHPVGGCCFYSSSDSLSFLSNQRARSKTERLEFVLLLASVTVASSEHVWFGGGELSPF